MVWQVNRHSAAMPAMIATPSANPACWMAQGIARSDVPIIVFHSDKLKQGTASDQLHSCESKCVCVHVCVSVCICV